jgi:hypothetical protein
VTRQKLIVLGAVAAVVLGAGIWLGIHRDSQQSVGRDGALFADLEAKLCAVATAAGTSSSAIFPRTRSACASSR